MRVKVLDLPLRERPDGVLETPFVLIFDQASEEERASVRLEAESLRRNTGALFVLATSHTIDVDHGA